MAKNFGLEIEPRSQATEDQVVEPPTYHPLHNEFQSITFQIHDADDETAVAYIALNAEGLPIKVNRAIVDADVILPIGCPNPVDTDGLNDCIYPDFCNVETQARYRDRKNSVTERKNEIKLANEHLGSFFLIQVVYGAGGQINNVVSGERVAVIELSKHESAEAWSVEPLMQAEMSIVSIETDPDQQTWRDFARAVVTANSIATSEGPIFVWSELNERPKSEIRKALNESFETGGKAKLSGLMQQLASVVSERQVFLKSRLSQSVTEELGLGFVDSVSDMQRLIDAQPSGVFLRDAHLIQLVGELESQDAS